MTYKEFVKTYKGKKVDYDGMYGVQCVDLIKQYIKDVMNTKPQSIGNAKEYWYQRNKSYLKSMFVPVVNSDRTLPRQGDVFVRTSGACGHIGICTGKSTTEMFYAYEENYGGTGEGMTLHKHTNWSTINFLRPRHQYVKANGGLKGYKTLYSTKHCILIPNGSKVEIVKTECIYKKIDGVVYSMELIKYNGRNYYVASDYIVLDK